MLAHLEARLAQLEAYVGPSWGLCWPILRLGWPSLRPMLAHVDPSWATCSHKWEKTGTAKNTVKHRGFWRHAVYGGGRRQGWRPLSPSERKLPYGNATASSGPPGPLAGIKRLRATAGQGPNYVGPSCGYVGLCWPILRALSAQLGAMLAQLGAMLAYLEGYVGRSWGLC